MQETWPEIEVLVASDQWPANYASEVGDEDEESRKVLTALMANMPLAMGLLLLALVTQFNSIRKPAIILLTLPPLMIGVVPGMLLTGQPFGFMPLLGLISPLGIIVNNAITLIDRIDVLTSKGVDIMNVIVLSVLQRSKPIIMTTNDHCGTYFIDHIWRWHVAFDGCTDVIRGVGSYRIDSCSVSGSLFHFLPNHF